MYNKLLVNYFSIVLRKKHKVLTSTENQIKSCLRNCSLNRPANHYRVQKNNCSRSNFSVFDVFSQSSQNKNFDLINRKIMHQDSQLLFNNIQHTPFSVRLLYLVFSESALLYLFPSYLLVAFKKLKCCYCKTPQVCTFETVRIADLP